MAQENCELCEERGATTPEKAATWAVCLSGVPLIYVCEDHLAQAQRIVAQRHGVDLAYDAILLTADTERMLQLASVGLPSCERPLASARIKLKTIRKAGSNYGVCRMCHKRCKVSKKEWDRAANPKCSGCGGLLDREEHAMTPRELTRHERALRRD